MADDPRVAALIASAQRIGADPLDYATVMSYETGGTLDPSTRGGAGNRHIGLIQFGPAEQRAYGASQDQSFEQQLGAVERYLVDRGFKPGMGRLDLYSTINAGSPGRYGASDAGNGGAPGSVADKVRDQMGAHEQKASAFLGGSFTPRMPASAGGTAGAGAFGLSGPVAAGAASSVTPAAGATMQAPAEAERGPDVAAILKALTSTGAATAAAAPQAAAAPAPMPLQPVQRRAQPFDAAAYLASLQRTART